MPTKKRELYPSDKLDQYIVRFPEGMRDRIKQAAADNNRSMNAEIIARLDSSFEATHIPDELRARVRESASKRGRTEAEELAARLKASFGEKDPLLNYVETQTEDVLKLLDHAINQLRKTKDKIPDDK